MSVIARSIPLVLLVALPSCSALIGASLVKRQRSEPTALQHEKILSLSPTNHWKHVPLDLRGGCGSGSSQLTAVADYSDAARSLFGGFITPASILITALVPMTLHHIPVPKHGKSPHRNKLRGLYYLLCLLATFSEMITVISATMASSQILQSSSATGVVVVQSKSAFQLVMQNYELAWIATLVHFIGGLLGFVVASGIGAYLTFPEKYRMAGASFAAATLLWIAHMINGRAETFRKYGLGNFFSILSRYYTLVSRHLMQLSGLNILGYASVAVTLLAIVLMGRALALPED